MKRLLAYTDEAGNTGKNLFDSNQPFFWTGTLLASKEFNPSAKSFVDGWCARLGFDELHGSELGLHRIEQLARDLRLLIDSHDLRFVFTRLEKAHLAATKFTDTVFDSGRNDAVSPLHYQSRFIRLYITHILAELMDRRAREDFWKAYTEGDCGYFCTVVERLEKLVRMHVTDHRTEEVLIDALVWARSHAELILDKTATGLDSPNAVSIGLLVHALQRHADETSHQLARLIHDETCEFGIAIKAMFESLRRFKPPPPRPSAHLADWAETDSLQWPIEIRSSALTPSLQIVDVLLWLVKRFTDVGFTGYSACETSVHAILRRSRSEVFSREELRHEVERLRTELMEKPVAESTLVRGFEIAGLFEERRQQRMKRSIAETGEAPSPNPRKNAKAIKKLLRDLAGRAEEPSER